MLYTFRCHESQELNSHPISAEMSLFLPLSCCYSYLLPLCLSVCLVLSVSLSLSSPRSCHFSSIQMSAININKFPPNPLSILLASVAISTRMLRCFFLQCNDSMMCNLFLFSSQLSREFHINQYPSYRGQCNTMRCSAIQQ